MSLGNDNFSYRVGGSLLWNDPSYVRRQSDEIFYQKLKQKHLCYVFNSRQQGKSSLRVQTMRRLQQEGIACAVVDLTSIGTTNVTQEQWFSSVADILLEALKLDDQIDLEEWWAKRSRLTEVRRFSAFVQQILLQEINQEIVIFLDEIDTVLSLPFSMDDFFAMLRECNERRAVLPEYNRLTFVLIGVATPSALMQDQNRTPFNVGEAIDLTGFRLEDCMPLMRGFADRVTDPQAVMRSILDWTGGQPFLTQRLCRLVVQALQQHQASEGLDSTELVPLEVTDQWVEALVQSQVIDDWETKDEKDHLRTIRQRLLSNPQRQVKWLGLYQQILQQGEITADESPEQMDLRLSGLVVQRAEHLRVYNRIYQTVFNLAWVERELAKLRPYAEEMRVWLESGEQDQTSLLRGETLQMAQTWSAEKNLSDADYRFLQASLKFDASQILIEAQQAADRQLAKANQQAEQQLTEANQQAEQQLAAANRQSKRRILIGAGVLAATVVAAIVAGSLANQQRLVAQQQSEAATAAEARAETADQRQAAAEKQLAIVTQNLEVAKQREIAANQAVQAAEAQVAQAGQQRQQAQQAAAQAKQEQQMAEAARNQAEVDQQQAEQTAYLAREGTRLERAGSAALRQYEFDPARALLNAMSAGKDLQRLVRANQIKKLENYPSTSPILALQTILDKIWQPPTVLQGHQDDVWSASFSPDGSRIVTASTDNTARVWDLNGQQLVVLRGHQRGVRSASFSPDGSRIVTASADGTARVWDLNGQQLVILEHQDEVLSASFSPDGSRIVTASWEDTARVWDLNGRQLVLSRRDLEVVMQGHQSQFEGGSYSTNFDGSLAITTSWGDSTAQLFSRKRQLTLLQGHQDGVNSASFSPDGSRIVTASRDDTARVWDLNGQQLAVLQGHQDNVWSASFSPDGSRIVTASTDGTARLWQVGTLDSLLARGCNWLQDYPPYVEGVTEADQHLCKDYLPSPR